MYNDFSFARSNPHQSTVHFSYHTSWERLILVKISVNKIDDPFTGPRFPSNDDCRAVAFYRKGGLEVVPRELSLSSMVASHGPRTARGLVRLSTRFTKLSLGGDRITIGEAFVCFYSCVDMIASPVSLTRTPRRGRRGRSARTGPLLGIAR